MRDATRVGYRCGCGYDLGAARPALCPQCGWDFGASGEHPSWDAAWCFVLAVYNRWTGKHIRDYEVLIPSLGELNATFGLNREHPERPREFYTVSRRHRPFVESLARRRCRFLLHHYELEMRSIQPVNSSAQVS